MEPRENYEKYWPPELKDESFYIIFKTDVSTVGIAHDTRYYFDQVYVIKDNIVYEYRRGKWASASGFLKEWFHLLSPCALEAWKVVDGKVRKS